MEQDKKGLRAKKYSYNTHSEWGAVYNRDRDNDAVVMVNEHEKKGLTRKIANMLNAGTL